MSRVGPTLAAHLVEVKSGQVVTVERRFKDPDDGEAPAFEALARVAVARGVTIDALGRGQLLSTGGHRTDSHRLTLGRTRAVVHPQRYAWEKLRAPLAAEGFGEIAAQLSARPPPALRPRGEAGDLYVVRVARVDAVTFDTHYQAVFATLVDAAGAHATLRHSFTSRGAGGCEAVLAALRGPVCFVSGHVTLDRGALVVRPLGLVVPGSSNRVMVQPWVDPAPDEVGEAPHASAVSGAATDPVSDFLSAVQEEVADVFVSGLVRADSGRARAWRSPRASRRPARVDRADPGCRSPGGPARAQAERGAMGVASGGGNAARAGGPSRAGPRAPP